jgi:hypothetical protein
MTLDALLLIHPVNAGIVIWFRPVASAPGRPFRGYLPGALVLSLEKCGFWLPFGDEAIAECSLLTSR